MCYSIFFPHILPVFCQALLCVYSHLEFEFWSKQKAREAGWWLLIALTVLFLLFFSVNCLLTFKLFSLIRINHIRQRYKEWRKYRIRVILVECHGNMACYVAYLFPVWIGNITFCPWNELSSPFLASANLNCCGTSAQSLFGLSLNGRVAGAAGASGADCLADHSVCEIRVAGGDKLI